MNLHKQHCVPGQVHAGVYPRAATVIALDGSVKMTYRNISLDWLPGVAPRVALVLGEGERHVLPCTTFVEIESSGRGIAAFAVVDPQPFEPLRGVFARAMRGVRALCGISRPGGLAGGRREGTR